MLLLAPGLRSIVGPERKVKITLQSAAPTELPSSLRGYDQSTGRSVRVDGGTLGGGTGWLGADDTLSMSLSAGGEYKVLLRLQEKGSRPVALGTVQVLLGGTAPIMVPVDRERISAELGLDGR